MIVLLTPVRDPDAAEKSHCQTSQTSHNDVCPCCLCVKKRVSWLFQLCERCVCGCRQAEIKRLTHEEVQDSHVDEVHQPRASVVGRRLFHCVTVGRVLLPPGTNSAIKKEKTETYGAMVITII